MPSFFQERGEEIKRHHNVLLELLVAHLDVADSGGHASNFLELELDGGTSISDLLDERFLVGDHGGESIDSVQDGSDDSRHLLEDSVRSKQESVLFGPPLDEFLILVESLELIERLNINVKLVFGGLFSVLGISNQTDLERGSGHVGESHRSDETLILLRVVILKTNLQFDSFTELAGLDLSAEVDHTIENHGVRKFRCHSVFPEFINN